MAASTKKVLVVDDEPGLADLAADYLRRIGDGLSVTATTSATEGLSLVRGDSDFDCVVSDYNMPEMNGLELLEGVREEYPSLPFVLYTGRGSEEIASEAISAGVTDYIQKDSGTEHYELLAKRIENAISQNRAEAELRETREKIEALHETAARAATCTDADELCHLAVDAAEDILAFDLCDISLCKDSELVPQAVSKGVPSDGYYRSTPIDADDNLGARAYRKGESIHINDLRTSSVAPAESDYRSSLTIPIDDHGVFQAVSLDVDGFTDRDLELAELLLAHVSAALDRMDSEEQLRNERDKFATLFRNIPHAIGVGNFEDGDPIIQEANPTFDEVFGWEIDDFADCSIDDLIVPDTDEARATAAEINDRIREGEPISGMEVQRITADGPRDFLLHTVCAPNEDADGFVIYTDITEQKRRERELTHQNEQLDEFATVLGHDLRNPLEVADGNARLLAEECDCKYCDPLQNALDRIEERVDEALQLAEHGQTVREPSSMSLNRVVEDAWEMVETGPATLTVHDLPDAVEGEPSRLGRLFENLFRNAIEHGSTTPRSQAHEDAVEHGSTSNRPSADGDPLTVEVGELDAGGVYVADDGSGVTGNYDQLFERGYTTDDSGTGLGLRIVEDVARAHGWSVRATDAEAGGLRVEIDFRGIGS